MEMYYRIEKVLEAEHRLYKLIFKVCIAFEDVYGQHTTHNFYFLRKLFSAIPRRRHHSEYIGNQDPNIFNDCKTKKIMLRLSVFKL